MTEIKDSGKRREFKTGAVRDIQEGKGRCDLMPLDIVAEILDFNSIADVCLENINIFMETGEVGFLLQTLSDFIEYNYDGSGSGCMSAMLELSKHFEEGAKKYGERNWEKGLPIHCYIDSAVRHYLKYLRGDMDECHDRAFMWNIVCCIWTMKHKPEIVGGW